MAPSSFKRLGLAFAIASAGKVAADSYTLTDEYTADNFFEKFDFYVSNHKTGDYDPTHGFVNYRDRSDAESLGLISTSDGKVYIGPDTNQTYSSTSNGRDSVRIMSKAKYNQGLLIAKFSHMPVQSCGSWPAFWSYGSPWLSSGEIDYYEGWNDLGKNVMALHTNKTVAGQCLLTTTGVSAEVTTQDCDDEKIDESIGQYVGTGCGVSNTAGVWGSTTGATFAMQWANDSIKIWNWLPSNVPSDITAGTPDPGANSDAWGQPQLFVEEDSCDLASAFSNQQLVFNIDFCGDTAGNSVLWADTCSSKGSTCVDYVAANPSAFAETYFMVEGIQFYELGAANSSVSVSASASIAIGTSEATATAASVAETSSGLLAGIGSVLESTLGVATAVEATVSAAATSTHSHTTSYITGTSTSINESGETTVVVVVDTTICPITAAEASESSVLAAETTAVPAQTTATSETAAVATTPAASVPVVASSVLSTSVASTTVSTSVTHKASISTATQMTTSTVFATHSSTISSCHSLSSDCVLGDVATVIVALSTTICPVTGAEASQSANASVIIGSASSTVPAVVTSAATSQTAAVQASSSTVTSSQSAVVPQAVESSSSQPMAAATSKTAALFTSVPLAAQSTIPKPTAASTSTSTSSVVTESEAVTTTAQATETSESALEVATGSPSSYDSAIFGDVTETLSVSSATYSSASTTATTLAVATSTSASAAASATASATGNGTCTGMDCIVVSNSGSKSTIGASGVALVAIAGAMFLI